MTENATLAQRRRRAAAVLLFVAAVPIPLLASASEPADAASCAGTTMSIHGVQLCLPQPHGKAHKPHRHKHHRPKHHGPKHHHGGKGGGAQHADKPYADRWIAEVKGHAVSRDGTETVDWSARATFLRSSRPGEETLWREIPGTASGTYHSVEHGEYCTYETTGTFDKVEGDIAVLPSLKQYWFDFFASGDGKEKHTCEGGTTTDDTRVLGTAMTGSGLGEPEVVGWNFSGGSVTGTEHVEGLLVEDISWTLGPQ